MTRSARPPKSPNTHGPALANGTYPQQETRGSGAAEAYRSYLSVYQPDVYGKSWAPAAYGSQSIHSSDGIAFTPECAQALVPYLDDIGAWIETGRPMP